jgi:adenylate kinase|tara:strand:+ start:766 stop:1416 length:651 start_codon:yes stop_codon:yes gene_type:complete
MNLIIFGPPGAGKGTQASFICKEFKLVQISTGDLLRKEIKKNTNLGKKIEQIINKGILVSDDTINNLLEKIISSTNNFNKLVFDGYPRSMSQVEKLNYYMEKYKQKLSVVISLNVEKDVVKKRIEGRLFCTTCQKTFNEYFNPPTPENHDCEKANIKKRTDDNIKTIIKRFDTYLEKTRPVLHYYQKNSNFYEIDGSDDIKEIFNKIRTILSNISN